MPGALLSGCARSPAPAVPPPPSASAAATPGIDLAAIDRSIRPGDDFFQFANGSWLARTQIPPDRASWGIGQMLAQRTDERVRTLLESAIHTKPGSDARKAADYYASFLDEAAVEAKGIAPLAATLARIAALQEKRELARELGRDLRADVDPLNNTNFHTDRLFGLWVSPGFEKPERNFPYLLQGGLGLPDREYYLDQTPRGQELRAKYLAHIANTLRLAGVPGPDVKAERVLELETRMAQVHATLEESFDVLRANNLWQRAEFATLAPGLDWEEFFLAAGLDAQEPFYVWQPQALRGLAALVGAEPLPHWQAWLAYHAVDRGSPYLPKAFVSEHFAFYEQTLHGTPKLRERWKRAVAETNLALRDAVGKLYVDRYFPATSKVAVQQLVQNLVQSFGTRIDQLDWMASETKARAREKLGTPQVGVGYPDHWINYGGLEIVAGDAFGNAERAELFEYRRSLAKLGQPVDENEWWMAAQVVNAVNLPLQNALNFPAALLVPPFFDPAAPGAVNYGAIGAVIGHEISHSFDDQGAQFDARGKLADWWTPRDREHFVASGLALIAQFDAYRPLPDLTVSGKRTLSENIADLAGLAAAHDAWRASLQGPPAPAAQGFSGDQQFFLAYAQAWRITQREPALRQQITTDGHAPDRYRADTVRNIDAWYDAFQVESGQALFLAPSERVRIW
jgi:putative endopeptidase